MADAYRVLNVSPSASKEKIRSAYVELACHHHPCNSERKGINPSSNHTQFRLVAEAFFLIGDDLHRELYDLVKSSPILHKKANNQYQSNIDGFRSHAPLAQPIRRSRASSELTIDLRVGLPPELRTLLVELDPIKLFNRVVNQIDQERKLKQQHANPVEKTNSSVKISPGLTNVDPLISITQSKSKYLSPSPYFLDETQLQRSRSPSKSNTTREDVISRDIHYLNLNSKPGILRDESKNQSESYRRITLEFQGEPALSRGNSRGSSYKSNDITTASTASSRRNNRSRRVSFSNDVIETDELKRAREVLKSFKSEMARKSNKPNLSNSNLQPSPSEFNNNVRGGVINKQGFPSSINKTSPPSSLHMKVNEIFQDHASYRDPDRIAINTFPSELSVKPFVIEKGSPNSHHHLSHLEYGDGDYYNPLSSSAPTRFFTQYREEYSEIRNGLVGNPQVNDSHSNHSSPFSDGRYDTSRLSSRSPGRDLI